MTLVSRRFLALVAVLIVAANVPAGAGAGNAKDEPNLDPRFLPWKLRDHYTFRPAGFEFLYGADNGQWTLQTTEDNILIDKVDASVTLADGKIVTAAELGVGLTTRGALTAELGKGIEYVVTMPAKDGISMRHSVTYHEANPYYVVRLEVKNEGTAPIEVSKISPVVIGPGNLKQLGPQSTANFRRLVMHGPVPVYAKDAQPSAILFRDDAANLTFGIGSLATGYAYTMTDLQQHSGGWQGSVTSSFDPPVRLEPGQSLKSDPAWVCFITPKPLDVDLYFAYAHNTFPKPSNPKTTPTSWVTVPDGGSFSDLQSAIGDWNGVEAALAPVTWEGRPGSLDGASPDWPRDMRNVASQLKQQNMQAGITVDPLALASGSGDWTAKSEDGQMWLNPSDPKGMEAGVAQMNKIAQWGFDFYVVAQSRIPAEVLKHFNISRARADALAVDLMLKAAGGAPVFAASRGAIGGERDEWLEAAAATARLAEYSVILGAVRFDAAKGKDIGDETATAIAFCGAPIEVVGKPSSEARGAIVQAISKNDFFARPIDVASPAPKLWQVETTPDGNKTSLQIAIVSFEGARASTPEDEATYSGTPVKTNKAEAAGYVSTLPSSSAPAKPRGKR